MARADRTVADELAAFAVAAAPVPDPVRARLALHLLDVVGCGLGAVGTGAAAHATAVAAAQGGAPEATLLGRTERVPAALAAFANGTRCHALDFDDTHEARHLPRQHRRRARRACHRRAPWQVGR